MANEITVFKYEQLDENTADFLRTKESNMRQIVGKAYTELGKELYEAQQRLAGSRYDGVFVNWLKHIGMNPQQAYRLIRRYTALTNCENGDQRDLLEDMPVSLAYEVTGPSAESTPAKAQAKSEVLAGEIESLKEYRERIAELERKAEAAEERANTEQQVRERLEEQVDELSEREQQAQQEAQEIREELERAKEANPYAEQPYGVRLGLLIYDAIEKLSEWQKEYSWMIDDKTEFQKMIEANPNLAREFNRIDKFWDELSAAFHGVRNKGVSTDRESKAEIIDVEYTEVV